MKAKSIFLPLAACGILALAAGCASDTESHLVTAPPPAAPGTTPPTQVVLVQQPAAAVATPPTSYIVVQSPPAPQPAVAEAIPPRPSSSYVWVAGYWTWQADRYAWMAGHWEQPPFNSATWIPPRVESEGGAYRFYEGHWN